MFMMLLMVLGGALFGIGCQFPESWVAVSFTIFAVLALGCVGVAKPRRSSNGLYLFGLVFSSIAFYWLPQTMVYFGGFPKWVSVLLFIVYCFLSSLQFLICGLIVNRLDRMDVLRCTYLSLPLAWLCTEFLWPRLFPWNLAHPLVSWSQFSALAELGGVIPLSALLLWWAQGALVLGRCFFLKTAIPKGFALAYLLSLLLLPLGHYLNLRTLRAVEGAPKVAVGVIQGNLEAKQKNDLKYFEVNVEAYRDLSRKAVSEGAQLLIWPEAIINVWTPEGVPSVRGLKYDPAPDLSVPLLYGAMSYRRLITGSDLVRSDERSKYMYFNSAVGLASDGEVLGMYHKQVLMPFGEYMPLADLFPQLKKLSPETGDFNFGDLYEPISFAVNGVILRSGTLICYEDLVPMMSLGAINRGANVLINLTNDAWYGDSAAPIQHHLLAMWRAIETRKFFIRATNTGFTGVVSPVGRTFQSLPTFAPGYFVTDISLLEGATLYSRLGYWHLWALSLGILALAFVPLKNSAGEKL